MYAIRLKTEYMHEKILNYLNLLNYPSIHELKEFRDVEVTILKLAIELQVSTTLFA